MILLTTEQSILTPFAWLLGKIFNGLFELLFNIVNWFTAEPWHAPIVALGIILFTIVVRAILLPLSIKQQKFSKLQNIMNPELQEVQAKYKGKKDNDSMMKMNEETKAIYAKYGASPSGGCLVMIIQLPIMFALYRVIYKIPGYVGRIKAICAVLAIASVNVAGSGAASADVVGMMKPATDKPDNYYYTEDYQAVFASEKDDAAYEKLLEGLSKEQISSLRSDVDQAVDLVYMFTSSKWATINSEIGKNDVSQMIETYHVYDGLRKIGYDESVINDIKDAITRIQKNDADGKVTVEEFTQVVEGYNTLFGLNMMESPWSVLTGRVFGPTKEAALWWVILIPILAGASQFISSMLMQSKQKQVVGRNIDEKQQSMQQSMKMMNYIMPLISVFFCFSLNSCIGIYWIISSVVQMIIQLVINNKMDHMDIEEMVQKNIEKENEKRAKKGLPPRKYVNTATNYAEQVKIQEARDARKGERDAEIKESTEYYQNANTAKPGSLAAKANMVKMFNERNNQSDNKKK